METTSIGDHHNMYFSKIPGVSYFHLSRLNKISSLIGHSKGKRILDVGCGIGRLLGMLNGDLFGVDVSDETIEHAKKILGNRTKLLTADARKLPYGDEEFDIVTCSEVLEHITNPQQAVNEILRVCKKGGTIVISVPNEFWITTARFAIFKWPPKVHDHVNKFSVKDVELLLHKKAKKIEFVPPFSENFCLFKILLFKK